MAIFLRGNTWFMEYRTRKVRVVKTTGFKKPDKAKAFAAYQAFRVGFCVKPQKSAMEKMLSAIYDEGGGDVKGIPLSSVWIVYEDWFKGKAKKVSDSTWVNRRNETDRMVSWAVGRGCTDISDVSVGVAREYVKHISPGRSNKTVRNIVMLVSSVWEAVGQIYPGIHNPWKAACPDKDGSAIRRPDFSREEADKVLASAKKVGHDWYLASMIALYTGLRYGDIALLDWKDVDLKARLIALTPNKTKGSSAVSVTIPLAKPLYALLKGGGRGFILPEHGVRYAARSRLSVTFADVLAKAGIKDTAHTFHSWRHTANSRMAEEGVPSEVRQMLCGWTNDEMARHYDHAKHLKELTDAVSKI